MCRTYLPESRGCDPSEVAQLMKLGLRSRPLASPVNSGVIDTSASEALKVV